MAWSGSSATILDPYDSSHNLEMLTDAGSNTTMMSYDILGPETAMDDPGMGGWSYE